MYRKTPSFSSHAALKLRQHHQSLGLVHRYYGNFVLLENCLDDNVENELQDEIHATFPICRIDKITLVNHRQMYGMYLLRKEEMLLEENYGSTTRVQELLLYHVTTEHNAMQSLENGLNWRLTERSRFGRGVSFSNNADYADFYANNSESRYGEVQRVIIVCSVLVAKSHIVHPNNDIIIPTGNTDTSISDNKYVFVKYNDYEFYPVYMVHYRRTPEDARQSYFFYKNKHKRVAKSVAAPRQQRSIEEQEQQEIRRLQLTKENDEQNLRNEQQRREEQRWILQQLKHLRRSIQQQEREQQLLEQQEREQQLLEQQEFNNKLCNCLIL